MALVSIGIPAHNEEKNIGKLLESIEKQKLEKVRISEIIIVANGCEDKTVEVVKSYMKNNKLIKLQVFSKRLSMARAVSEFIKGAKSEILLMVNGDVILKHNCVERLMMPFKDGSIGVTGARVIPLNDGDNFSDYFSRLWWKLFDLVAQEDFRTGEVIGFRKLVKKVPGELGSVENFIIDRIVWQGYKTKYVVGAVMNNMGPRNVRELFNMRRRHNWHTYQIIDFGFKAYFPKTLDNLKVLKLFLREVDWGCFKEVSYALAAVFMEMLTRILGYYDYYFAKRNYTLWPRIDSTKELFKAKTSERD